MRDGPLRRAVKRVGLGVFSVRLWLHRSQADIRYELGGGCVRSGNCCEAPGIQVGKLTWYIPFARRVFLWWHEHVNGFELIEASREQKAFFFKCTHFDTDARSCDTYESRPGMCRDYPLVLTEQANPEFIDGCGFRAIARNRDDLVHILDNQSLTSEQMKKLKKGLHLED
jgi:Fe-S-cluster containining protein